MRGHEFLQRISEEQLQWRIWNLSKTRQKDEVESLQTCQELKMLNIAIQATKYFKFQTINEEDAWEKLELQ